MQPATKVPKVVWIGAIAISIAAIVLFELVENRASDRPPADQQAATARDALAAAPSSGEDNPYTQKRASAMSAVRNAYFAVGCKVFDSDAEVLPLVSQELSDLNYEAQA